MVSIQSAQSKREGEGGGEEQRKSSKRVCGGKDLDEEKDQCSLHGGINAALQQSDEQAGQARVQPLT